MSPGSRCPRRPLVYPAALEGTATQNLPHGVVVPPESSALKKSQGSRHILLLGYSLHLAREPGRPESDEPDSMHFTGQATMTEAGGGSTLRYLDLSREETRERR